MASDDDERPVDVGDVCVERRDGTIALRRCHDVHENDLARTAVFEDVTLLDPVEAQRLANDLTRASVHAQIGSPVDAGDGGGDGS